MNKKKELRSVDHESVDLPPGSQEPVHRPSVARVVDTDEGSGALR
jgi:hypothetical protein